MHPILGYGVILKQENRGKNNKEVLTRYTSGTWNSIQKIIQLLKRKLFKL